MTDYFRSGKIFMAGNYNTNGLKNGLFQLFYENGNPFVKVTFSEDKMVGGLHKYNSAGVSVLDIEFLDNHFAIKNWLDDNQKPIIKSGNGKIREEFLGFAGKIFVLRGDYKDSLKMGKWIFRTTDPNNHAQYEEVYIDGDLTSGKAISGSGDSFYSSSKLTSEVFLLSQLAFPERFDYEYGLFQEDYPYLKRLPKKKRSENLYTKVDIEPAYPGGIKHFMEALGNEIRYPPQAIKNSEEAEVVASFVINSDGTPVEFTVENDVPRAFAEETIRLLNLMEKWAPGMVGGEIVRVKKIITIEFTTTNGTSAHISMSIN
ncbi:MAG: energy transducer TonB [Imperialibacter sp.]|uniref:energy transducer TonB n=1 Tax=Imperialibacter sp. TaxID=2038411 RepID=UPI0032EEF38D